MAPGRRKRQAGGAIIATIYGANLAYVTRSLSPEDIRGGVLPLLLTGSGVRVSVGYVPAHLYSVSPTQVNLLIPSTLASDGSWPAGRMEAW